MLTIIVLILLFILMVVKLVIQGIYLIHKLQQFGYFSLKYLKWLESTRYRKILMWSIFELLFPLLLILLFYFSVGQKNLIKEYKYITTVIMLSVFVWKIVHPFTAGWVGPKAYTKKPLVWTSRVIRLFSVFIIGNIVILLFILGFTATPFDDFTLSSWSFFKFNSFLLFLSVITPIIVFGANVGCLPMEKLIQRYYYKKAQKKMGSVHLPIAGITGSYGKTSTKYFLASILETRYKTLFSPGSFNTPMGLSKVINTNNLSLYEYFIAEMGADHKGDIKVLCDLVKPDNGIITAIDYQHLETFGSIDNIIKTKLSLFENLNQNGFGIYNYDSEILKNSIENKKFNTKLYSYSININNLSIVDICAKNIRHTREGIEFEAVSKTGYSFICKAPLLGTHNASNLLAAILYAQIIGLTQNDIENGIRNIKPVEHRLQLINSGSGVLVLDDAFNSNLKGAVEALKVLKEIEGGKKIIVTPGMVELGEVEDETNYIFGKKIAAYCDYVILVGEAKTKSIFQGIVDEGFDKGCISVTVNLSEAQEVIKNIVKINDIILFENDLPDTFTE